MRSESELFPARRHWLAPRRESAKCPECLVAYGERHRPGCFFLTGDPADLRAVAK